MPKIWMLVLLITLTFCLTAQQAPELGGRWVGKLSQEEGGFTDEYEFEIYIQRKDNSFQGRTYVEVPEVLGVMTFTAKFRAKTLYITEEELLYSRKPADMSWCFKNMQLRLLKHDGQWYLEGPWQGRSRYGICQPGWIVLKKEVPKV